MDKAIKDGIIDPETVKIVAYLVPVINIQQGKHRAGGCAERGLFFFQQRGSVRFRGEAEYLAL